MFTLQKYQNKKIAIYGMGITGCSAAKTFQKLNAEVFCWDDEISIYSIVKMICHMMDYDFETSVELIDQNFGQDSKFSISSDKLRSELNWKPKISLKEGVQEVIFWIEKNWNEISKMQLEYIHKK